MKSISAAAAALGLVAVLPAAFASPAASSSRFPTLSIGNVKRGGNPLAGAEQSRRKSRRAINGPLLDDKGWADPGLIKDGNTWKSYATSSNGKTIPVASSSDLNSWTLSGSEGLEDPGSWADSSPGVWAPEVVKTDDGFVMYYSAAKKDGGARCIGAANATSSDGPFTGTTEPLVCDDDNGGVIDPSSYWDGTTRWLVWKVDGNSRGGATTCQGGGPEGDTYYPTPIMVQKLAADGLSLDSSSQAAKIFDNAGEQDDGIVEAPGLYQVPGGQFVLIFSTHCYSSDDYDIEYAWSDTIDGTYGSRDTLLSSKDNVGAYGPGHAKLDADGTSIVFHGRKEANTGEADRLLFSGTISFDGQKVNH